MSRTLFLFLVTVDPYNFLRHMSNMTGVSVTCIDAMIYPPPIVSNLNQVKDGLTSECTLFVWHAPEVGKEARARGHPGAPDQVPDLCSFSRCAHSVDCKCISVT